MILPNFMYAFVFLPVAVIAAWLVIELRMSKGPYSLKKSRKPGRGFADLLSYAALVHPDVILNKDGAFMASYEFYGDDTTTFGHSALRRRVAYINRMFCSRDKGWMFHVDFIRRPADPLKLPAYLRGIPERVLAEERIAHAKDRYLNRLLIAVTYLPPSDQTTKHSNLLLENDIPIVVSFERTYEVFTRGLVEIEDQLRPIGKIRRIGAHEAKIQDSNEGEPSEFLANLVNVIYADEQKVTVPQGPVMLSGILGAQDLVGGMKPRIGEKHLGVLNIAGFPPNSYPGILKALAETNATFRFSTRIILEDPLRAREKIDESYRNWFSKRTTLAAKALSQGTGRINRDADHMAEDAEQAITALDRGLVKYVYYTAKVVLLCETAIELEESKRIIKNVITRSGFMVRDEALNVIDAYLGSLWGDGYHDLRKYMLHTVTAGDIMLTSSDWTGRTHITCELCPDDVEPMAIVQTRSKNDFALDLHHKDVMHLLSLGSTGSGKTTLLNFLAANFARVPDSQFFGLDFGYGMYTTCQYVGGQHIDPRGLSGSVRFPLFTHIDDPGERSWVADLLGTIAEINHITVTPKHRESIDAALELFVRTPSESRSLTTFLPKLADRSGELRTALLPYTVGGSLDGILDGTGFTTGDAAFSVFELSNIVGGDNKERVLVPVMMLLFHMIQRKLINNRRTFVAIDEAWSHFRSPAALPKLEEALRTFRKLHAGVGLFSQNLDDIVGSPLASTVISACQTQILLPNPQAISTFQEFYKTLGLGRPEILAIANAQPKREYYLKAEDGCAMIDLALTRAELAIYGHGGSDDLQELRMLMNRHPQTWREEVFRVRGCEAAARRIAELSASQPRF